MPASHQHHLDDVLNFFNFNPGVGTGRGCNFIGDRLDHLRDFHPDFVIEWLIIRKVQFRAESVGNCPTDQRCIKGSCPSPALRDDPFCLRSNHSIASFKWNAKNPAVSMPTAACVSMRNVVMRPQLHAQCPTISELATEGQKCDNRQDREHEETGAGRQHFHGA